MHEQAEFAERLQKALQSIPRLRTVPPQEWDEGMQGAADAILHANLPYVPTPLALLALLISSDRDEELLAVQERREEGFVSRDVQFRENAWFGCISGLLGYCDPMINQGVQEGEADLVRREIHFLLDSVVPTRAAERLRAICKDL